MGESVSLGDKERDVEAGIAAGVGKNLLFSETIRESAADAIVASLKDAEAWI